MGDLQRLLIEISTQLAIVIPTMMLVARTAKSLDDQVTVLHPLDATQGILIGDYKLHYPGDASLHRAPCIISYMHLKGLLFICSC